MTKNSFRQTTSCEISNHISSSNKRIEKLKLNGKTVNVKLKEGEFVAWTITDGCGFPLETDEKNTFRTKKEAKEYRKASWAGCYSEREMEKELPIFQYVFAGKFGMEENVPVCSVEDRIKA